jgi:DNA-binding CsgD family transcriptional regulator
MRAPRGSIAVDLAAAGALAAAGQVEIWAPRWMPGVGDVAGDRPVLALTALAATLPLALRRRFPLAVLLAVITALGVQQLTTTPTGGLVVLVAGIVAAYSSSAYSPTARAAVAGAAIVVGAAVMGEDAGDWAFIAVVFGGAWLVGFLVAQRSAELAHAQRDNRQLSERLADAADQLALARRQLASGPAPEELATLTRRELEVVRAVARGMSNAEIAVDLVISEWTVKTHVASVLCKLGLRDRAQIVVAAYESRLVGRSLGE